MWLPKSFKLALLIYHRVYFLFLFLLNINFEWGLNGEGECASTKKRHSHTYFTKQWSFNQLIYSHLPYIFLHLHSFVLWTHLQKKLAIVIGLGVRTNLSNIRNIISMFKFVPFFFILNVVKYFLR